MVMQEAEKIGSLSPALNLKKDETDESRWLRPCVGDTRSMKPNTIHVD